MGIDYLGSRILQTTIFRFTSISLVALALTACGGGDGMSGGTPQPGNLGVGGSLSGLAANTSVVLRNNGSDSLTLSATGTFTFATTLATGSPYNVTVFTQPTGQTCTVANGSGTLGSAAVTNVSVLCTPQVGKFLYVPNVNSNNVSAYSVNASTGALTAIAGSPFTADQSPALATADPAGKFLFVINRGATAAPPRISAYSINASTGALTQNLLSPFPVTTPSLGNGPTTFNKPIVHPSGKFMYEGNVDNGKLYGASIDSSGGLLELPTMNVGARQGFGDFNAAGTFLYVPHDSYQLISPGAGGVAMFQVNTSSGVLTPQGEVATNARNPLYSTLTPSGKFLLVSHLTSNTGGAGSVAVLAVNTSGMLTAVAGSPFTTGGLTSFVVAHPTKNFVYANSSAGTNGPSSIAAFQIDANTGVLTPITGSPFSTGGVGASFVRIDPAGKFLYVANSISNTIQGFTIDQTTGALTVVSGSPWTTDGTPLVTLDPSGRYLYSTNAGSNTIASYAVNMTTGALTIVGTSIGTGTRPVAVEIVGRQ